MVDDGVLSVIENLYEAASEPRLWPQVLQRLSGWLDCRCTHFIVWDEGARETVLSLGNPGTGDEAAAYVAHYGTVDPNHRVRDAAPLGRLVRADQHFDGQFIARNEFYQDFYLKYDYRHMLCGRLHVANRQTAVIGFHRAAVEGPWSDRDVDRAHAITPHLRRAVQLRLRLDELDVAARGLAAHDAFDRLGLAVIVVTGDGLIAYASPAAEAMLRAGTAILQKSCRLQARNPRQEAALAAALQSATLPLRSLARGEHRAPGTTLALFHQEMAPISLFIAPLPRRVGWGDTRPLAIIFISEVSAAPQSFGGALSALYNLTKAEARLAEAVVNGERLQDYADRVGITVHTAKSQLKQVFGKTGFARQSDLVRAALVNLAVRASVAKPNGDAQ